MNKREQKFVDTVWEFYRKHKRESLPWRKTKNPYKIVVSEVMLQQTQVDRVLLKYRSFIKKWPTAQALRKASLGEVLKEWQGLGYNRRAKNLQRCAQVVCDEYKGKFPKTYEELQKLPGIGPYTAGAMMAFAYNKPVPIIETNIRTVYLHHFFKNKDNVSEADLVRYIVLTLDQDQPREWYWALMDYGSYLKRKEGLTNTRAKSYTKQSKFEGSDRQIRGTIIRLLTQRGVLEIGTIKKCLEFSSRRINNQLDSLTREGMVDRIDNCYSLPGKGGLSAD